MICEGMSNRIYTLVLFSHCVHYNCTEYVLYEGPVMLVLPDGWQLLNERILHLPCNVLMLLLMFVWCSSPTTEDQHSDRPVDGLNS